MIGRQIRSEWIKAASLRATWIIFGIGVIGLIAQALTGVISFRHDSHHIQSLNALSGSNMTLIVVMVLGVVLTANEYGSKSIISTYTTTPNRAVVVVAKTVVAMLFGVALGVLSVPIARLVAALWFAFGGGGGWDASLATSVHYGYGTVIAYAGFAVLGVVAGVLVRSVGVGISVAFVVIFILDSLLASVSFYSEYAVNSAAATLLNPDIHQGRLPLFGSAIALLAFYCFVLVLFASGVERYRDVGS
jgi:hypothetical protein